MVAKDEVAAPPKSPGKPTSSLSPRKSVSPKKKYKPSRVTVEYFSNSKDHALSPTHSTSVAVTPTPERRSALETKRSGSRGRSLIMSNPLAPTRSPSSPRSPRSPRSKRGQLSPKSNRSNGVTIRSQLSNLSRKLRKDKPLLLSNDDSDARMANAKTPKTRGRGAQAQAQAQAQTKTNTNANANANANANTYTPPVLPTLVAVEPTVPVVASGSSINDSGQKDKYEMADTTTASPPPVNQLKKNTAPNPSKPEHRSLSQVESGMFTTSEQRTDGSDTYGTDTFEDDAFSLETYGRKRSFLKYRFTQSLSDGSSFADGTVIIRQHVAWGCIFLSAAHFAVLTTQVLMCGIAKMNINPTIGPYPDAFSEWGGKNSYLLVEEQQYFRLITPTFLHVGYLHLLVNAFFQLETCAYLEREWGFVSWFLIYLMSGFGASLAASTIDPNVIGVCSSGALMGLFGARIAQAIVWSVFESRNEYVGQGTLIFERLGGTVCSAAVVFFLTFLTYIDWSGHLGGLVTGFLTGMVVFPFALKSRAIRATLRFIGLLGLMTGGMVLGYLLFHYTDTDEDLADACDYFRNLYTEGYLCECKAFD